LPVDAGHPAVPRWADYSHGATPDLSLSVHTRFESIENEWRGFERIAEGTPFQTYEWLRAWHRHIGERNGVVPVIVVARYADGAPAFIAPFAIERRRWTRRLCWLGQELCDYNAPLLAQDFSQRVSSVHFLALWRDVLLRLRSDPELRYDWIEFEKMPLTIGGQNNPFVALDVIANANSAHIAQLSGDWETFYRAKRSSATRRHDRAKRKRMVEYGEISFRTVAEPDDLRDTLEILWEQKKRIFARKGIGDIFSRPGYREFFADFACNPNSRHLAHVSRVDVGAACAAANFAIVFGDCYYHVLASYCDGRLTRHGPGMLHLRELLAHAIKIGMRRFDFTIGDEQYKLDWTDIRLPLYDYSTAATLRGWPASVASIAGRHAKRFIKQTPVLWHLVCRLRSTFGPLLYPHARSANKI
jgi:CelD/BcsL family acetyltransferase involved in cellulose biosynthesis